jgi:hypothetical protein
MRANARGQRKATRKFLLQHGLGIRAEDNMDLVNGRIEIIEKPLCVKRAAGSSDGYENSQSDTGIVSAPGSRSSAYRRFPA